MLFQVMADSIKPTISTDSGFLRIPEDDLRRIGKTIQGNTPRHTVKNVASCTYSLYLTLHRMAYTPRGATD